MRIVVTLLCALAGLIAGWIAVAAATIAFGGYFGLSEFEGERSMTAFFGSGPIGGLAGIVIAVWLYRRPKKTS